MAIAKQNSRLISVVVPIYNEAGNIARLHTEISRQFERLAGYDYELICVNDGSTDDSVKKVTALAKTDRRVRIIDFSRNFGKEIAITAGLNASRGDAAIMIDADLQHPVALIPEFLAKWSDGAEVVVGVRQRNRGVGILSRLRSWLFYKLLNSIADTKVTPRATDYRLLDRVVIDAFNQFTERHRISRGLIDWLGFRRDYLYFEAGERVNGKASYSLTKLMRLAIDSFVSLSLLPLKLAGYLGIIITIGSGLLGIFIFIEKYVMRDPHRYAFSGPAILAVILLFLVGIILSCLGLIALYIANIHSEVVNRPLYVIRPPRD